MRKRARTVLCGGRSVMVVPTASPRLLDQRFRGAMCQARLVCGRQLQSFSEWRRSSISLRFMTLAPGTTARMVPLDIRVARRISSVRERCSSPERLTVSVTGKV
jgi:hypothetical protein